MVFLYTINANAQNIVSCSTLPLNPIATDTIRLAIHLQFNSGGCDLQSYSTNINGNSIDLTLKHCTGLLTYICDAYDTINIGMLNTGLYQLNLDVQQWSYDFNGNCVNYIGNTQQSYSFNVGPAAQVLSPVRPPLSLTWSAASKQLSATGDFHCMELLLSDINGKTVFHGKISPGIVNLTSTPASDVLLYQLSDENGKEFKGKITLN